MIETPVEYYYGETLRWSFGFENPNKAAVLFACLIPLLWWGWLKAWQIRRVGMRGLAVSIAAAGFLGAAICLLMTFSRGGLAAALCGSAVIAGWWFIGRAKQGEKVMNRTFIWSSAILLLMLTGAAVRLGVLGRSVKSVGDDASVGNRVELWHTALQMAYENPRGFGSGRSGEEFMRWYQPLERNEGYRTMVNSYLTFLVERGWFWLMTVFILIALFWTWTWPRKRSRYGASRAAMWGSLTAFIVAGIFSSTMEEWALWILPIGAAICLIVLTLLSGNVHLSMLRLSASAVVLMVICGLLAVIGALRSSNDSLRREFGRDEGHLTVTAVVPKSGVTSDLDVMPDPAVLGPDWAKLIRDLAMKTGRRVSVIHDGAAPTSSETLLVAGERVSDLAETKPHRLILLAPSRAEPISVDDRTAVSLLLPEIDEDGRVAYWREVAESSAKGAYHVVTLAGVGTQVDWAWDQVAELMASQ